MTISRIPHSSGVYLISNVKTNKVYIGQAQNIRKRWNEHRRDLNSNRHHNVHLQRAWNKYGERAFRFLKLEYCSIENLDDREQHYLDLYMAKGLCYNIAVDVRTTRGVHPSEETKQKMGEAARVMWIEKGKQIIEARLRNLTAETRYAYGSSSRGKPKSAEHREKIGASQRKRFIVTAPDGSEFEIAGLAKFCRENGLDQGTMSGVASGKFKQHKGWKCRKIE